MSGMTKRQRRQREAEREQVQRTVSKLIDDAPEWRGWLEWQLRLLELEYDRHHWLTMEWIR